METLKKEAIIITQYLIGVSPSSRAVDLYINAHKHQSIILTKTEQSKWNKVLRFPLLIQFVDAGYALQRKQTSLRKKILTMFAILESLPEYSNYFLPKERSASLFSIFFNGCIAILRTSIGALILWIL